MPPWTVLTDGSLPAVLERLGLDDDATRGALRAIPVVLADDRDAARLGVLAERLRGRIGAFLSVDLPDPFDDSDARHRLGTGVLPALAFIETAHEVAAYEAARGIPEATVWAGRDAVFFTFATEPPVDLAALPRDTTLQRAVVDTLQGGGHFRTCSGHL